MDSQITQLDTLELDTLQKSDESKTRVKTGRAVINRNQQCWIQRVEQAISQIHPMLQMGDTIVFNFRVRKHERLVVVHEFNPLPSDQINAYRLVQTICQFVQLEYGFQVYGVVFVEQGSLPRDKEGEKHRYLCRQKFISGELAVVDDWCEGPQYRRSFQTLKQDLEALLSQIIAAKTNADQR